jgi:hypothetical protein
MQSRKMLRKRQNALNDVSSTTHCTLLLYLENKPVAGFSSVFPNITTYRNRPRPDRTEPARSAAALSALGKLLENISITIRRKFTNPFAIETSE